MAKTKATTSAATKTADNSEEIEFNVSIDRQSFFESADSAHMEVLESMNAVLNVLKGRDYVEDAELDCFTFEYSRVTIEVVCKA